MVGKKFSLHQIISPVVQLLLKRWYCNPVLRTKCGEEKQDESVVSCSFSTHPEIKEKLYTKLFHSNDRL